MSSVQQPSKVCQTPEERLNALMSIASKIDFMHGLDIQQYFRVMHSMKSTVDSYIRTNQKEAAYTLASKFAILYLQHLPKHREYSLITGVEKKQWNERCKELLNRAESLKAELRARYEQEYEEYLEIERERLAEEEKRLAEEAKRAQEVAERSKQMEKARAAEEKRASVLGTLVPKSRQMISFDGLNSQLPRLSLPSYPGDTGARGTSQFDLPELVPPIVDRSSKPVSNNFNVQGCSTVRLSPLLAQQFLKLAEPNTRQNKETCGSLCGRLVNNEFHITDLVLSKQDGTPDSCTTYKEEELFEYMEKRSLLILGWIHTHPSQTAFLSSVDQHTQLSYQVMLPEAIAIVCSPKFNETKIFSLTADYGLPLVRQCKLVNFHPHPETAPIFEESKHVTYDPKITFNVVDLRLKI